MYPLTFPNFLTEQPKYFNRQMRRNEKDLAKFNALPKGTQEKLLGKFLAGNSQARQAFEKYEVQFSLYSSMKISVRFTIGCM